MTSIINACKAPDFPSRVVAVISDNAGAKGLDYARAEHIQISVIDYSEYNNRAGFEKALYSELQNLEYDCICLAGFMRVLSSEFLEKLGNKTILNIHPSLLPKHKGLSVHQKVLKAGDTESGCTVHKVTAEVDSGEIIVQKTVPVMKNDTEESLAQRILEKEHIAYPEALRKIAKNYKN